LIVEMNHIEGTNKGRVRLFALSTCIWCKKTKALLKELDVGFEYVDVDTLDGPDREGALQELKQFNPQCSFPSLVLNDGLCIIGFKEADIKEALKS
jgi:glutaredoxin-like protein NrdH